ncbi:hypothetical protein [Stenotrophomonas maltophilia]|nr:hypothetical protein [Stenotrophomonas maltophilia]
MPSDGGSIPPTSTNERFVKDRRSPEIPPAWVSGLFYCPWFAHVTLRQLSFPEQSGKRLDRNFSVANDERVGRHDCVLRSPADVCRLPMYGELINGDVASAIREIVPIDLHAEGGPVSIYYANRQFLPAKTRAFVDYVAESFRSRKLAERF